MPLSVFMVRNAEDFRARTQAPNAGGPRPKSNREHW